MPRDLASNRKKEKRHHWPPAFFVVIGILILAIGLGHRLHHYYQRAYDPYGLYYRLIVDLADKQGRSIGIDIVIGCGTRYGRVVGGGTSVDVMAMDAMHYAWKIPGGHALSVRTSQATAAVDTCTDSTTDNGQIPPDWLPFVIWHESADDLSHGLAYATQDAYANPRARIIFRGAQVKRATAADFLAFKARGPANLIPAYLSDALLNSARPQRLGNAVSVTPEIVVDPKRAWRNSDWLICRGVIRVPLSSKASATLSRLRPIGAAKYWHPSDKIKQELLEYAQIRSIRYSGSYYRPETPSWSRDRPKVYRQSHSGNLDMLTKTTFADGSYHKRAIISPSELGFMDCGRDSPTPVEEAVTGRQVKSSDHTKQTCFVDGVQVGDHGKCYSYIVIAVENSEYVIIKADEIKG